MIGMSLAHYRITAKLGAGGMGEVFLAEDTTLGRQVAIKFLPADYSTNADKLERFRREARAAAALNHPNIITIHDVGTHDGRPYLVLEHVDGEPLSRIVERKDLTIDRALEIATQIFEGLSAAHEVGVIHRDIKPDNILIDRSGRVRILDFGLAKLHGARAVTAHEAIVGTVEYMSPEQVHGAAVDERSDLFSAGVIVYEMVTGRRPFVADHRAGVLYAIAHERAQPMRRYNNAVSDELERIVSNLLAKNPEDRYPSAKSALADIRRERGSESQAADVTRRKPRPWSWIGVGAVATALVVAAVWYAVRRQEPSPTFTPSNSIAVLPFVNMSNDSEQEYFSDGLSEELINVLTRIPDLKVSGRTSSFSFKGKSDDLPTIGAKLGVANILEGSVRKGGNRIRVTAQLVKAADGFQLWSATYDRTVDDIFAVQDEIALSVARELRVTLGQTEAGDPKPDAAAYDLVLQARFVMQVRNPYNIRRGREMVERALLLAPHYAPAWAELGHVHLREAEATSSVEERRRANEEAREALARALEEDPGLAIAHARMSVVQANSWEFADAERSVNQALTEAPRNPNVMTNAALLYAILGSLDEAIALEGKRIEIDPLASISYFNFSHYCVRANRLEEADAMAHKHLELSPESPGAYGNLGDVQLLRGDAQKARALHARSAALSGRDSQRSFYAAIDEYTAGDASASATATTEFEQKFSDDPAACAQIRAWRGETDLAFAWLEEAIAERDPALVWIQTDIYLRNLRGDPRWKGVLHRVGFPDD